VDRAWAIEQAAVALDISACNAFGAMRGHDGSGFQAVCVRPLRQFAATVNGLRFGADPDKGPVFAEKSTEPRSGCSGEVRLKARAHTSELGRFEKGVNDRNRPHSVRRRAGTHRANAL
jgi:hypothetical protein